MPEPKKKKKQDPIHKVELADGRTRWRFTIDVGTKPAGKRDQRTFTYDTKTEARNERSKIIAAKSTGTYVAPTKITVAEVIDNWLAGKRNLREGTLVTYRGALAHARDHFGHEQIQKVTKAHVDDMVTKMLTGGRRVGNRKTKTLTPRTVNVTLIVLASVFEDALKQGIVGRNVVKLVGHPSQKTKEMQTWTAESAAAFLAHVADDRLSAGWQMSLYGLRRGEVLGLRWSDIDLVKKTLTVRWNRTVAGTKIVEQDPKTERGKRTLPLDDRLAADLDALLLKQREEADRAGEAYRPECEICGGQHVIADELGRPLVPVKYSDQFVALARQANLPAIRLHDARHTAGTLMHLRGVPTAVISKWLGHASAAFTLKTYVHSQDEALTDAGLTLANAYVATVPAGATDQGDPRPPGA